MKTNIDIDDESLSDIVLQTLKLDYKFVAFEQDQELLDALKKVIQYYTTVSEYTEWSKEIGAEVEQVCCDGGGPMTPGCYHDHCTGPKLVERK